MAGDHAGQVSSVWTQQPVTGFKLGQDTAGFAFGGSPWGMGRGEARGQSRQHGAVQVRAGQAHSRCSLSICRGAIWRMGKWAPSQLGGQQAPPGSWFT